MRHRWLSLLVLSLSPGLDACQRAPVPELRIGINPWPGYEYLYLASEMGLFDSTVARVRVVQFSSISDARRAFERSQVDGFTSTVIEVLQARDHSPRRPLITYVTDFSQGADVVIARRGVTDVKGLKGHRVGAELNSLNIYLLSRALELSGLTLDDVTVVPVDLLGMRGALARGKVDAVVTYPPASLEALRVPGAHPIFSSAQIPGEIVDVISVDSSVVGRHPAAVVELVRGFERARRYADEHPEAYAMMAAREGLGAEEFRASLSTGIRLVPLAEQEEFLRTGGKLTAVDARVADLLNRTGELNHPQETAGLPWVGGVTAAQRGAERDAP